MGLPLRPGDVKEVVELVDRIRGVRRRLGADHATILQRTFRGDASYSDGYYVIVGVAPSRRIQPLSGTTLTSAAIELAVAAWPDTFDSGPTTMSGDWVRFERRDNKRRIDAAAVVTASGLVETMWRVPHGSEAAPRLSVDEVMAQVASVAIAVQGRAYAAITRRRRVDWHVNLTANRSTNEGTVQWARLALPDGCSVPRASSARAFSPVQGFAAGALRSRRRTAEPFTLLRDITEDLLLQNGYYELGTVPAVVATHAQQRAQEGQHG